MSTPLGDIEIYIDNEKVEYTVKNIGASKRLCPDISGRFCIEILYEPDGRQHTISCRIKDYLASSRDGIESGERLELKSFYRENTKLSIGMEGDAGYYMKQINTQMIELNNTINKLADFQTEILENNDLRNEEIQRLQTLETTCMDLLNQANRQLEKIEQK